MPEPLLLRSQTSIVYVLTIFIYFFFGWILYSILMSSNDPFANILAVGLACLWLTYSINVILSLKVVLFYESYLTITAFVTRKKITIQYHEFSTFHYVPKTINSMRRIATKSENDKITLTTTDGKEIYFREMQFDNFSSMRVFLQKIIRGEHLD
jgi:hypothetical protein